MTPEEIMYIAIGVAVLFFITILTATIMVGKHKGLSGLEIFGLFILGIFFWPIWLIVLIVLPSKKKNEGYHDLSKPEDEQNGNYHYRPYQDSPPERRQPEYNSPTPKGNWNSASGNAYRANS